MNRRTHITRQLAKLAIIAHRKRQAGTHTAELPKREVPDSYVYDRTWLGFWRKRPTVNTAMGKLPKAIGEK